MTPSTQDPSAAQDMGELLEQMDAIKPLRRGDVVEGVVMRADSDGILVNIGHKAEAVVPAGEMRTLSEEERKQINVGDNIVTLVVKGETAEQAAILSVDRAAGEKGWQVLKNLMDADETVNGKILGFNRGGAIVEVESVNGFVPMSQLVTIPRNSFRTPSPPRTEEEGEVGVPQESVDESNGEEKPSDIGKELSLKILELDRGRNRAIFSERRVVQAERDQRKAKLIEELTEGETRRGTVTGISRFGAFVDLGGADGLVHISELSWSPVRAPEDVVSVGDELDVYVLRVDAENRKIALSLRRLHPEPWQTITDQFEVGDIVDATVTKLTNFGAFARVEGSVEGLIHISELTSAAVNHPKEVVGEGDAVKVKILRIEPERRRLGLSIRRVEEEY